MEEEVKSGELPCLWPGGGGAVVMVVAVGLGVLGVWGLFRRCRRQLDMRRVVQVEREALYRFLSDPLNLKIIHPYTTDIRIKKETEEEEGVMVKEFDWVEKVPFTAVSAVHMRCDPTTFTITMNIVPAGGVHQVCLEWCLKPYSLETFDVTEDATGQSHQPTHRQDSAAVRRRTTMPPEDAKGTRPGNSADDEAATADLNRTVSGAEARPTEFHNQIQVTGPRVLVVLVVLRILRSVEGKLMDQVVKHFENIHD